jgi:cytoskeleton protein RodZ
MPAPSSGPAPASVSTAGSSHAPASVATTAPAAAAVTEIAVPQEVILEAMDTISVQVQIDGSTAQTINMAADQIRTFKAKRSLKLKLSDGGAASIIYNGKDSGVPGDLGKPVSLAYPK